ncbi:putative Late nodulin [Medicago truncatula]|uniref:Nodule Cysteine-Rich (NCR) secreted peptide n=1 Tax=Medicago truncatula TaxID=3880 RepID=A0A072UHA9_MEDTR|nr:Nodule Cysteine-Rich (NCR) secreted peptide [Medicago truncatula]RHN58660.1 putative Late nodulin [Medicago truncatula]
MVEILKFVYALILFLSIIVSTSSAPLMLKPCITDKDCPKHRGVNGKCRKGYCVGVGRNY